MEQLIQKISEIQTEKTSNNRKTNNVYRKTWENFKTFCQKFNLKIESSSIVLYLKVRNLNIEDIEEKYTKDLPKDIKSYFGKWKPGTLMSKLSILKKKYEETEKKIFDPVIEKQVFDWIKLTLKNHEVRQAAVFTKIL
jgi:heterodisulfide reductase subunit B